MRHKKSTVAAVLSTLWMIASAAALTALYISEKYIAFLLAAIQLALPGIIDLILIPVSYTHLPRASRSR